MDGLAVQGVTVTYGSTVAVRDASLDVPVGDTTALLGPSGCGKSSLLRAIAGLEPLQHGSVRWRGSDLSAVPVHKRNIGLMFQDHALFPHRTVAENVAFGLRMAGRSRAVQQARTEEMLDLVGLEGFGDRTIGTLSGGQAQRVALARALAPEPALLLLDEPLGSLDRSLRDRLTQDLRTIINQTGTTAIHVTHDHDEAISVADSLALMEAGTVIRSGPVDDLLANPGDVTTAEALGLETVLTAPVDAGVATTPFGTVRESARGARHQAHFLLRPAHVRVARSGDEEGVPATVTGSRHHGSAWLIDCHLADGTAIVAGHPTRLPTGSTIRLLADLTAIEPLAAPADGLPPSISSRDEIDGAGEQRGTGGQT